MRALIRQVGPSSFGSRIQRTLLKLIRIYIKILGFESILNDPFIQNLPKFHKKSYKSCQDL
jgi:hypothetical protein